MDTIIFPWGPFTISVLSLSFSVAIIISLIMVYIAGRRSNLSVQTVIDFILICLVSGVIGGRLTHVLAVNRSYYLQHLDQIIHLQDGGMSFWGGFILALVAVMIWSGRRNYILKPYLDAAAPALALGLSIGRIGYPWQGKIMSAPYPWGIIKDGQVVHPEGVYAIILLMLLYIYLTHRRRQVHYQGELILIFIAGYGLINLIVDHFSRLPVVWGWATAGQLVSLAMIILAVTYFIGGSKIYSSSYYFNQRIYRRPPSRFKLPARILWLAVLTAAQVYSYYLINGIPVGLIRLMI
ncbi:MAG TPA: hypothetical protein GX693_06040 [Firmicutes bacterium]|nr:hypothetical protein [Bacillota bacterium]